MKLNRIFQNGMILQCGKRVPVWGTAFPGEDIRIYTQGGCWSGTAEDNGEWMIYVGPLKPAESISISIESEEGSVVLDDVAIGDVYVAGGQSNMEFHMKYEMHYQEELSQCLDNSIRFYDVPEIAYEGQDHDFDYSNVGIWRHASPDNLEYFSAPAYYFAKKIRHEAGIPTGIIGLNWGGTRSSVWMSEEHARTICPEQVADFEDKLNGQSYEELIRDAGHNPMNDRGFSHRDPFEEFIMPQTHSQEEINAFFENMIAGGFDPSKFITSADAKGYPGALFAHMVKPTAPFGVKGVLWYQGESDDELENSPGHYLESLTAIVNDWRELWNDKSLPFIIVQLPGFRSWLANTCRDYNSIRSAQKLFCDNDSNAFLCSISDLGEEFDIHPKNKSDVGERMALLALKHLYGREIESDPPVLVCADREDSHIVMTFEHAGSGLKISGDEINALKIIYEGKELQYECFANGSQLKVNVPEPCDGEIRIEFASESWYIVNLYNSTGIPAIPFTVTC